METLALSLIPCLLWLFWFWLQDWYDREPPRTILLTFLLGALATLPAMLFNTMGVLVLSGLLGANLVSEWLILFLVVGPVEEAMKLWAVAHYAYRRPEFDEPVDGVVYGAAAALGFAAAENVLYLSRFGSEIFVVRGILSNPGHALFAAFWGLALSRAKMLPNVGSVRARTIARGWGLAALLHALFDAVLLAGQHRLLPHVAVVGIVALLMLAIFVYVEIRTVGHVARSPHRRGTMMLAGFAPCPHCGHVGTVGHACAACGRKILDAEGRRCPTCGKPPRAGVTICLECGADLAPRSPTPLRVREPHLVRLLPDGREEIAFILDRPVVTVGKTLDNHFVIDDPTVSKHHAKFVWHPSGAFVVVDLGSTNGTYVNGQRVQENLLRNGFEVRFGRARFIYRAAERAIPVRGEEHPPAPLDPRPTL
ncbi:MAG: PrsW family glutamic-type intramembrane protease [Blastocatellia bacterium]|nr:PrsW family glutamic-type intramembrane protease [Blastocatellia bacterium]MCS7156674.1 PrsW family glutamic-type intramembrane protease [Blastocatellia bacterium]MCX7751584.1 PrsW family glutamic-type intramembrane protease [Blastocatellia bacterium]MDW8168684.1 PrsW family glutamic-type intramembrane protease [Acidobacteriota bacterium]MDW8255847.1 PrsW family glutamic-type intramembrane protease [Acidobacteriota bacterium]